MKYLIAGLTAAACVNFTTATAETEPVKATFDAGVLVGENKDGVNYFRGVPFAKPPIGELRWKAPQRPAAWAGERAATAYEPACPQPTNLDGKSPNGGGVWGATSEDCLYLQVTAPENADNAPIMVWFYGGASYLGGAHLGSYEGTTNAKNGVITIPVNYRLGALGAFAHPALTAEADENESLSGYALMDAVEALRWVQRNARAFGGDPNNVTIAGQSAGGFMVVNLLSIPEAEGLFHKAIVQSGAGLRQSQTLAESEKRGATAATALGLDGANATADELRSVSAQSFVANTSTRRGLGPARDGRFRTRDTVDALEAGTEYDVPVLVGSNAGEGGFNSAKRLASLAGDEGAPAFLYRFTHTPDFRKSEWRNGPIHSAELMFTFDSIDTSSWAGDGVNRRDRNTADKINSCWVAFMKAERNATELQCADGFTWPAHTTDNDAVADLSSNPSVKKASEQPDGPPRN